MLTEVFRTENGDMLEKTEQNLNREQWEREVRKKNVVIRKLPECKSEDAKARFTHDMNWLTEEAGVEKNDIVKCYRPGRRSEVKIRPLICVLKTEELVQKSNKTICYLLLLQNYSKLLLKRNNKIKSN